MGDEAAPSEGKAGKAGKPGKGSGCVLEVKGLRATRENGFSVALPDLTLHPRQVAALLGPSGCGKSTLLQAIFGLNQVTCSGTIRFLGRHLQPGEIASWRSELRSSIVLVPQDAKAALDPLEQIGKQIRAVSGGDRDACETALRDLAVEEPQRIYRSYPHQVSGGQAQRALLAMALLRQPELVVADEPTASLDDRSVEELVENLKLLKQRHRTTLLLATHDQDLVQALGGRSLHFDDGRFLPDTGGNGSWPNRPEIELGDVVLQCKGLRVDLGAHTVVRGADLALRRGEIVAVVGPSGCGKTTLARALAGHLSASAGWISGSRHGVQMLFQEAYASLTPHRTIRSLVQETAPPGFAIDYQADRIGLSPEDLGREARELSGGERRRAALLRALSVGPKVLILDEPTASLDRDTAVEVMRTILEAQAQFGLACLLITHDISLADAVAHKVLRMEGGRLCERF